jgi:hypothetical protein
LELGDTHYYINKIVADFMKRGFAAIKGLRDLMDGLEIGSVKSVPVNKFHPDGMVLIC